MFNKIVEKVLSELYNVSTPVLGHSAIMQGPVPTGFKGSNVGGIAQGAQIPLKIKKKKRIKGKKRA